MTDVEFTLVGCVKGKADECREARNLYTSPLFKKRRRVAESNGAWAILSAEHAFLWPEAEVSPYDTHISKVDTRTWRKRVIGSLVPILCRGGYDGVVVYAGSKYVEPLVEPLEQYGFDIRDPNSGLRPGERSRELKKQIRKRENESLVNMA